MKKILPFLFFLFGVLHMHVQAYEVTQNKFFLQEFNGYTEAISPDGRYVVGSSGYGFLWDMQEGTIVSLEPLIAETVTEAVGVNSSGVVAGNYKDPETLYEFVVEGETYYTPIGVAAIWKNGTWEKLGLGIYTIEDISGDYQGSLAYCISEDGKKVGGSTESSLGLRPGVWTYNDATQVWDFTEYSTPEDGWGKGKITCMTPDGSIVAGYVSNVWGDRKSVLWKSPTEYVVIGDFESGTADDGSKSISSNGKYIAFSSNGNGGIYNVEENTYVFSGKHEGAGISSITAVTDNGLGVGYSQFATFFSRWRVAFAFSEKIGFMDMGDFVATFASDMVIPTGFEFDSEAQDIKVPMDISADGKSIIGWTGPSNMYRNPWVMTISSDFILYNKPSDLQASLSGRNNVSLTWTAPEVDPLNELKGYIIYRDNQEIAQTDALTPSYLDVAPGGKVAYRVVAKYDDGTSPATNTVTLYIVDTYNMPLVENFESMDFNTNYWTPSNATSLWSIVLMPAKGISVYGATFENYLDGTFDDALVSRLIDATGKDNVYLTFALRSELSYAVALGDYVDKFVVEAKVGTGEWQEVKEYSGNRPQTQYGVELLDLSEIVKGQMFQIRFRVEGNGQSRVWTMDNIRVDVVDSANDAPDDIMGRMTENKVNLVWTNPTGAYELSYEQTPLYDKAIGNEGTPFMAVIAYDAADLTLYKGKYLTSVTAYINQNIPESYLGIGLVIFDGDNKIEQDITNFTPNDWNTFILDSPILIDGTKSLKFGINVTEHDAEEVPIATDSADELVASADGKGNLYSEDGGATWHTLSENILPYVGTPMPYNWTIIGNVTTSATPSMTSTKDENIGGYIVYRNGVVINNDLLYLPQYTDTEATEEDTYVVRAYYLGEALLSPVSAEYTIRATGIENNRSENKITVYPNPAIDVIYIEGGYTQATLIDVNGKIVSVTNNGIAISVENLPNGIYFLEIMQEQIRATQKVIIKK